MQRKYALIPVLVAFLVIAIPQDVYGGAQLPDDLPIAFSASDGIIIFLGVLGGLTVAFLGNSNASKTDLNYSFDGAKFIRPIIVSVLTSVPLAITASLQYTELNIITMFLIYAASGFVAEVSNRLKAQHIQPKK